MRIGRISSIQRLSTHDGPGMRTTVFFKGCPLRCSWCHNPETLGTDYSLAWKAKKCIGCKSCENVCPTGAVKLAAGGLTINKKICIRCFKCAIECPSKALVLYGKDFTAADLVREIRKDMSFFQSSGGGVTLSGGEVLMQWRFALEVLKLCKAEGINTALDTSCFGSGEGFMELLPYTNILLADMKLMDQKRHEICTGAANLIILKNLLSVKQFAKAGNELELYVRTPIIPGYTDDEDNIRDIGRFIVDNLNGLLVKWELILFHNMCEVKYRELGMEWQHRHTRLLGKCELDRLKEYAMLSGMPESKIVISGLAVEDF